MSFTTNKYDACIAGIYEHPLRVAPNHTVAQLHAEVARGALQDAGLTLDDVDAVSYTHLTLPTICSV